MRESIEANEDLLRMLDSLLREPSEFWDTFYADRNKNIPFFENKPDENLVAYFNSSLMDPVLVEMQYILQNRIAK